MLSRVASPDGEVCSDCDHQQATLINPESLQTDIMGAEFLSWEKTFCFLLIKIKFSCTCIFLTTYPHFHLLEDLKGKI